MDVPERDNHRFDCIVRLQSFLVVGIEHAYVVERLQACQVPFALLSHPCGRQRYTHELRRRALGKPQRACYCDAHQHRRKERGVALCQLRVQLGNLVCESACAVDLGGKVKHLAKRRVQHEVG
eukprot:scaffold24096_cov64-Phaeocystis_antarctica.AAC.17